MEAYEVNKKVGIKGLIKSKNYMVMFIANFISRFGDSVDGIAYGWMVYMLTGSKLLLGTLFAVNAIPNILLGPFAGVFADRLDKKKLITLSYLGRGIMVSLTALLYFVGILRPWHLFIITIFNSTFETLMMPAMTSLMPLIVDEESYLSANSFSTSAFKFAELIGTAMAGAIIALIGISGAIFVDAATFFIAALIMLMLKVKHEKSQEEKLSVKSYISELKVGFKFVKDNKLIRLIIILFAIVNFGLSPVNVMLPIFAKDILQGGPEVLSMIGIAFSLGTILGGIIIGQIGQKFKITNLIIVGFFLFGIDYALLFLPGTVIHANLVSIALTIFVFFTLGFLIPMVSSPISAYMMSKTDKQVLGRVSSFMGMISCCAIPLGSALTGVITEYLSASSIFLIMGIMISLVALSLNYSKTFKKA